VKKIGFLVNPIAGMGGAVGLKGTDDVSDKALLLGAKERSGPRALEMLTELLALYHGKKIPAALFTCSNEMGANELEKAGILDYETVYDSPDDTSAKDTRLACAAFMNGKVDLIVFCGGDGTTRDIYETVGRKVPILGVPAGVKMHSGVFGMNPAATAKTLKEFIDGRLSAASAEVMDLDEELYRQGEWSVRLFGTALTLAEPHYVQVGKMCFEEVDEEAVLDDLAEYVTDRMREEGGLWLLGPGSTVERVGRALGVEKSVLGIDAVENGRLAGSDLNEKGLLALLDGRGGARVVLSPVGAQGFILGRGNLELSPAVLRKLLKMDGGEKCDKPDFDALMIIATPAKLAATPVLRVDTGDAKIDSTFDEKGHLLVATGYRSLRLVAVGSGND